MAWNFFMSLKWAVPKWFWTFLWVPFNGAWHNPHSLFQNIICVVFMSIAYSYLYMLMCISVYRYQRYIFTRVLPPRVLFSSQKGPHSWKLEMAAFCRQFHSPMKSNRCCNITTCKEIDFKSSGCYQGAGKSSGSESDSSTDVTLSNLEDSVVPVLLQILKNSELESLILKYWKSVCDP